MLKVIAIVKREFLQMAKNPLSFLWTLVFPVVLVIMIGQISFGGNKGGAYSISIPVVVQDNSPRSQQFLEGLRQVPGVTLEPQSLEEARQHVEVKNDRGGYIIIPEGFGQAFNSGQPATLKVVTATGASGQVISSILQGVVDRYNTTHLLVTEADQQARQSGQAYNSQAATQQALKLEQTTPPALKLEVQAAGTGDVNSFDQAAPGYATMFVLLGLNTIVAALMNERNRGTLKRLAVMPVPKWAYMSGKMLTQFLISFVQVAVMLAVAALFFHAHINAENLAGIIFLVALLSFAAASLGMLLGSLFKNEHAVRPVVTLVALVGSLVGGAWYPLWLLPTWVQQAGKITINSWAMQGFNGLMIFGQGLAQVWPDLLALLIYGVVCLFLATRFFKYSEA